MTSEKWVCASTRLRTYAAVSETNRSDQRMFSDSRWRRGAASFTAARRRTGDMMDPHAVHGRVVTQPRRTLGAWHHSGLCESQEELHDLNRQRQSRPLPDSQWASHSRACVSTRFRKYSDGCAGLQKSGGVDRVKRKTPAARFRAASAESASSLRIVVVAGSGDGLRERCWSVRGLFSAVGGCSTLRAFP